MRLTIAIIVLLAGCAGVPTGRGYSEEEMMTAAAALTKMTAAAEGHLRYGSQPDMLSDAEFLTQAVAHDPELLQSFGAYQVKVVRQDGHVVTLVCTRDGAIALLEDAGCTAAMDRHRWRDNSPTDCSFTIDLKQICPVGRK